MSSTWWPLVQRVLSAIVAIGTIHFIYKLQKGRLKQKELKKLVEKCVAQVRAEKQHVLTMEIDDDDKKLSDRVIKLAKRCHRYGTKVVNAVTHALYDEAHKAAKELEQSTKPKGPLQGIFLSVKDHLDIAGTYSTCGMARLLSQGHATRDAALVAQCKKAGALVLCKANVPQLLMSMETNNRLWGRTSNPWDLSRSPGGSTGGDAALVAMKCVTAGLGTDVAGSCRIPAAFCGIVGFKPTPQRMSNLGNTRPRRAGVGAVIPSTAGLLSQTVQDTASILKALWVPDLFEVDAGVAPIPFREELYQKQQPRLNIGYFETDNFFEPCQALKRGIRETITALQRQGHNCFAVELPADGWVANKLLVGLNASEGNMRSYQEGLEGEEMCDEYKFLYTVANLPNWIRFVAKRVIDKRRSFLLGSTRSGGLSSYETWDLVQDLMHYQAKWKEFFSQNDLDAIIGPAVPIPAVPHKMSQKLTSAAGYMFPANLLQWPCGTVPVTVVKEDEQHYRAEDLPIDQRDLMMTITQKAMDGSAGMPLGVNVMALPFQDEKCLRVMKEIEKVVDFSAEPTAYKL